MVNPAKNNRTANVKGNVNFSKTVCQGIIKLLFYRLLYGISASLASHTSTERHLSARELAAFFSPQSRGDDAEPPALVDPYSIQHSSAPCSSVQHPLTIATLHSTFLCSLFICSTFPHNRHPPINIHLFLVHLFTIPSQLSPSIQHSSVPCSSVQHSLTIATLHSTFICSLFICSPFPTVSSLGSCLPSAYCSSSSSSASSGQTVS